MPKIASLLVQDVRFPTSLELDGSDAVNVDPDHSAAYLTITVDDPSWPKGHGFVFTGGRGNDVLCYAIEAVAKFLPDEPVEDMLDHLGEVSQAARARLAVPLDRAGEGRQPHGRGRRDQRPVGHQGEARRPAAVEAARADDARGAGGCRRLRPHHRRAHPRRCARDPAQGAGGQGGPHRRTRGERLPRVHDRAGLARLHGREDAAAHPRGARTAGST